MGYYPPPLWRTRERTHGARKRANHGRGTRAEQWGKARTPRPLWPRVPTNEVKRAHVHDPHTAF